MSKTMKILIGVIAVLAITVICLLDSVIFGDYGSKESKSVNMSYSDETVDATTTVTTTQTSSQSTKRATTITTVATTTKTSQVTTEKVDLLTNTYSGEMYVYVNTESSALNLRAEPSAESEILGEFPRGTGITVYSKDTYLISDWVMVKTDNGVGYLCGDYLSFRDPFDSSSSNYIVTQPTIVETPVYDNQTYDDPDKKFQIKVSKWDPNADYPVTLTTRDDSPIYSGEISEIKYESYIDENGKCQVRIWISGIRNDSGEYMSPYIRLYLYLGDGKNPIKLDLTVPQYLKPGEQFTDYNGNDNTSRSVYSFFICGLYVDGFVEGETYYLLEPGEGNNVRWSDDY